MKILTDCAVHLLSRPEFIPHPKYELPPDGQPVDRLIATAGKVCYDTYGHGGHSVDQHVTNLVKQHHYSVLEHANYSVFIEGVSRALTHELVRHRHFSYSQRSTRYTDEKDCAIVLEPYLAHLYRTLPPGDLESREFVMLHDCILAAEDAMKAYGRTASSLFQLADTTLSTRDMRKWARGKARQRLPHDLETRLVMTGNLTAWREMLIKRTSRHAEPEIRRLAQRIFELLNGECPNAFTNLSSIMHGSIDRGELFIELLPVAA